jgi:hypothetical protein
MPPPFEYGYIPHDPFPPPFTAPLPPAVPLPPPIRVLPAVPPLPPSEIQPFDILPSIIPGPIASPPPNLLPERPDNAEPPAGALRQGLSEYDRRIGTGSSGAIVSLARSVAMGAVATGSATVEVIADRSGAIRSARIIDVDGDRARWEDFAEALRSARTTTMRIGEGARGVWMHLYVTANVERTSGRRQWWSPGVLLAFDIADVSARQQRVVQTSVLSEVWF